ncbi:DNA polymerase lambda [Mycena indigotica]|uniref:DNA-directed DNA polymerase n=1 Tax=Mycena indigotica TaxID=2126181 RepID=A0A8H6SD74_9AGAR|nr:DNA polymerase lambda [Mycena indigotica]KAF7297381.1 DNA polymerase lambda [Mycena indigotica]
MQTMDIDAFFREQDEHMNIPVNSDELLTRFKPKGPMERPHVAFALPTHNDTVDPPAVLKGGSSNDEVEPIRPAFFGLTFCPHQSKSSMPHSERSPRLASNPVNVFAMRGVIVEETKQPIPRTTLTRLSAHLPNPQSPCAPASPTSIDHDTLKRKQSPTKPEKPAPKKRIIDPRAERDSPEGVPAAKPSSKQLKSLTKVLPPLVLNLPIAPIPPAADISSSPIEDANFSVLINKFEPQETSTQPQREVARQPTEYELMMMRVKQRQQENANKKRHKHKAVARQAIDPGTAGPSTKPDDDIISISSSRPASPEINPARKPSKPKKATNAKLTARAKPKPIPLNQTVAKKKQEATLRPREYAEMLLERQAQDPDDPLVRQTNHQLEGCTVIYIGPEMENIAASPLTRGRWKKLIQYGATLSPVFNPETVTHIVCDAAEPTVRRWLNVKKLSQVPSHIPIVGWTWALRGGQPFEHAIFPNHMPEIEGFAPRKGKEKDLAQQRKRSTPVDSEDEESDSERRRHERPSKKRRVSSPEQDKPRVQMLNTSLDPLAEFHDIVLADLRAEGLASDSEGEDSNSATTPANAVSSTGNPNQYIMDKLQELMELHEAKGADGDQWRVMTYKKVLRALKNVHRPIKTYEDAMKVPYVAEKTAKKASLSRSYLWRSNAEDPGQIMEIVNTGDLQRIKYENTPELRTRKVFQGVYGVGPMIAQKFYNAGCRTLLDLVEGKGGIVLTEAQKVGIQFYDDINSRMPREEAQALFDLIKPVALKIDPKLEVHIMGSFRRGKATCGDIDIMITRDPADGKDHRGILHHLLKALHKKGIITEDLALPENPFDEEAIYRGLCRLPDRPDSKRRRIDFLTIPWKCRGAALLYYTGDDIFNRKMRYKANKMGYSLNQKGLYAGVVRNPSKWSEKTNTGNVIACETEEEIFAKLEIPFLPPCDRMGKDVSVYPGGS